MEKVPQREKSRDQAAVAVGLSGKLVSAAKAIKAAGPKRFEKIKAGKLSIAKAKKEIKAEQDQCDLAEELERRSTRFLYTTATACPPAV